MFSLKYNIFKLKEIASLQQKINLNKINNDKFNNLFN